MVGECNRQRGQEEKKTWDGWEGACSAGSVVLLVSASACVGGGECNALAIRLLLLVVVHFL